MFHLESDHLKNSKLHKLAFCAHYANPFQATDYLFILILLQVISLIGIFTGINSEHARVASLWFVLLDAIILPQTLWMFNSRYRAAYRRIWNGIICKHPFCSGSENTHFSPVLGQLNIQFGGFA